MFKFKKEKQVVDLILRHIEKTGECIKGVAPVFAAFGAGNHEELIAEVTRVNGLESEADGLLRDMRKVLYSGAYLPLIRGDIYRLVSAVDNVANKAEECCDFVYSQQPDAATKYGSEIIAIVDLTSGCFDEFRKALKAFFGGKKSSKLRDHARKVGELETLIDGNQRALLLTVFESDIPIGDKVQMSRLISRIARISDGIEDAAEELELVNLKSVA